MTDKSQTNHDDEHAETPEDAVLDPIQEAEAFRTNLRDLLGRVHRLVRVLKTQRRQTKLVRSTLASLKQLQEVA